MRLQGKIALITGAGSGIGKAAAHRFAKEGARLVISDVDAGKLEVTRKEIADSSGHVRAIACDVGREDDVVAMFRSVADQEGRLDTLYNNAGISGAPGGVTEQAEGNWRTVFAVNTDGTYYCCREAIGLMDEGGSIINQSSVAALVGGGPPGVGPVSAYSASKAAVSALTRTIAYQYGERNIRCNAILPGSVRSGMTNPLMDSETYRGGVVRATPLGRFGEPEEIASIALFLASDDSSFISGECIVADGAFTIAQGEVFPRLAL